MLGAYPLVNYKLIKVKNFTKLQCRKLLAVRDKTLADKLVYNDASEKLPFSRFQLVIEAFGQST